jgi:hypothetical protein
MFLSFATYTLTIYCITADKMGGMRGMIHMEGIRSACTVLIGEPEGKE